MISIFLLTLDTFEFFQSFGLLLLQAHAVEMKPVFAVIAAYILEVWVERLLAHA